MAGGGREALEMREYRGRNGRGEAWSVVSVSRGEERGKRGTAEQLEEVEGVHGERRIEFLLLEDGVGLDFEEDRFVDRLVRGVRVDAVERVEPREERAQIGGHGVVLGLGVDARSHVVIEIDDRCDERRVGANHYP